MPRSAFEQDNAEIAREFLEAIAAGNVAAIERLLHPQLRWWVLGFGAFDRATFIASLQQTIALSNPRSIDIHGITVEDERVAVEASGQFQMATTVYANSYHYLFVMRDGQIVEGKEYLDTLEAARVFGEKKPAS